MVAKAISIYIIKVTTTHPSVASLQPYNHAQHTKTKPESSTLSQFSLAFAYVLGSHKLP